MNKKISKSGQLVLRETKRLSGYKPGTEGFNSYAILLASVVVGANQRRISKLINIPVRDFSHLVQNIKKNKIWSNGKVYGKEWFEKDGGIALALDAAVAMGYINKVANKKEK